MFLSSSNSSVGKFASWLLRPFHARTPTRESIVVTAFLAVLLGASYLAAFFVRGELLLKPSDSAMILSTIGWVVGIKLVMFYWRGFCHRPWRAARFEDLNRLLRTTTTALLVLVAFNYFAQLASGSILPPAISIPRSVLLLDWAFTLIAVGGMQALARSIYEEIMPTTAAGTEHAVLVVDASPAGRDLALALPDMRTQRYFVAGLLDDDPEHYGATVGRARVLGPVAMAPMCAERLRVGEIIVREGAIYGQRLRALCDACATVNVRVRIAVNHSSIDNDRARATVTPIRVRDVELHDLLTRPACHLSDDDFYVAPFVADRCVLVTGAGGSIGAEICRQLVRFHPSRVVLVDRSEPGLFAIHRELADLLPTAAIDLVPQLCDIGSPDRVHALFAEHRPHVVVHAAAFKHVSLVERHPIEAIENNTLATAMLAETAAEHGVETFVSLSTDKAVYPSSVMGASKLISERFLQSLATRSRTKFVVVRFGNVLGSSGSVLPIFADRLRRRLPLTITDPAVRRYFLTGDEAAQLSLLAGAMSPQGGVYVLEMGEPLSIVDLVGSLAFVMHVPQGEVRIEYCGLQPGEKLEEQLFFADEERETTASPFVIRARRPALPFADVQGWLAELREAVADGPDAAARKLIQLGSLAADGSRRHDRPSDPSRVAAW
ncbi:MAG: polysaccharide biosynthesis protein [Planctomycetia bacterium]|nr:polysaccharide biosynthesis protein [Planctomycetia bacterium]